MKEPELALLLFKIVAGFCIDNLGDSPAVLFAAAKRFRIDPSAVKLAVAKQLGSEDEKAPAKKATKKKAKRK